MEQILTDPLNLWDLLELIGGFLLGIAARIKFMKPRDVTIMLQIAIFTVRLMKWTAKAHHPIKKTLNREGVDQDLTIMHRALLKEQNLDDKTAES